MTHEGEIMKELADFIKEYQDSLEAKQGTFRLIVGSFIGNLMKEKGLSKAQLARELNTSRANVTMMLGGDRNLTIDKIYEIFHCLGEEPEIKCKEIKLSISEEVEAEFEEIGDISPKWGWHRAGAVDHAPNYNRLFKTDKHKKIEVKYYGE